MVKNISILGSTGSIGTQALDVSRKLNLNISAITCLLYTSDAADEL
mgnify:CR=1 FL=1